MSDDRLMRALGASAAPAKDGRFVLAVMERAEAARFRRESLMGLLRTAGLAAAGASLLLMLGGWVGTHPDTTQTVIMAAAGLLGLIAATRLLARTAPARR